MIIKFNIFSQFISQPPLIFLISIRLSNLNLIEISLPFGFDPPLARLYFTVKIFFVTVRLKSNPLF